MEGKAADPPPATADGEPAAAASAEAPRRRGGAKRKAGNNFSSPSSAPKRLIKERNALQAYSQLGHNGPVTRARQSPNKLAAAAAAAAAALQSTPEQMMYSGAAEDGSKEASAAGDATGAEDEELSLPEEPLVDAAFEAVRSRGSNVHAVPTPAGWFSWKSVHPVEKHMMPSFFSGKSESRTPDVYMEIRNSIMGKFHANPEAQVELKDLSELTAGDMDVRQEVMEFLDHWGLINFHPFPPSGPEMDVASVDGAGEKSSLVEKLYRFETVRSCAPSAPKKTVLSPPDVPPPTLLPESAIADDSVRSIEPSVEYHCDSCSSNCSRKRYHCQKQADFDLCTECYNDGKFGSGMVASDFILMESADVPGGSGGSWTDQETLLLLEALELFGENWNEIAEHVATKTKAQCMLHFIQMPIEDYFLEGTDDNDENNQETTDPALINKGPTTTSAPETEETGNAGETDKPVSKPCEDAMKKDSVEIEESCRSSDNIAIDALKAAFQAVGYLTDEDRLLSFAEAGNPVMALAAFLAGLVEPAVATTSFRSALKSISEDSPGIQLATRHCFLLEDPPSDGKEMTASKSAITVSDDGEVHKKGDQIPISNENEDSKDCTQKTEENAVFINKETEPSISLQDCSETTPSGKEAVKVPLLEVTSSSTKDSGDLCVSGEQVIPTATKDPSDSAVPMSPNSAKESGDLALRGDNAPIAAKEIDDLKMETVEMDDSKVKTVEIDDSKMETVEIDDSKMTTVEIDDSKMENVEIDDSKMTTVEIDDSKMVEIDDSKSETVEIGDSKMGTVEINDSKMTTAEINDSKMETVEIDDSKTTTVEINDSKLGTVEIDDSKMTTEEPPNSLKELDDTLNVADIMPTSVPSQGEVEAQNIVGTDSSSESGEKAGNSDKKASPIVDEKKSDSTETSDDHNIDKLRRAALTALSAAAVKAKLLANQEEEQIRKLVLEVIEKQLHKLETKLSVFAEMENMIMRAREHIDRARQRLSHERQLIISARGGHPQPSVPTNKITLGYGSTVLRPPNMAYLKPPLMRRP